MKRLLLFALTLALGSSCLQAKTNETDLNIIPQPQSITMGKGSFKVKGANFNYDSSLEGRTIKAIAALADDLYVATEKASSIAGATGVSASTPLGSLKGFYFLKDGSMGPEEYSIEINGKAAKVTASGHNGFLYALMTLRQMLPAELFKKEAVKGVDWAIPCCTIKDSPRFAYRGLLLDVARHFYTVEQVKKFLDLAAYYKVNRFHWHLTEDQGWRIEIKKYPYLTEIGAFRSGTQTTYDRNVNDGKRYGGYYTQDQIREVVEYANGLGITVIPEIDLPGHMLGAMASYPWLGCTGGPYQVWTRWGVSDQVLCVGKETTFEFLFNVLDEICGLFPSEYIHIGGDECPKTSWEKCPACQAKMDELGIKEDERGTRGQKLQNYVTKRVQDYLAGKGRKIIGWDEVLEGDLAEGATVMSWRGAKGGKIAAGRGFDVIMSPNSHCYFDYREDPSDDCVGVKFSRHQLPLEKVYSYDPYEDLDDTAKTHILGVQANVWTEYIHNENELFYLTLPRLLALSEVQWSAAEARDYRRFLDKAKGHLPVFDILGYNYHPLVEPDRKNSK